MKNKSNQKLNAVAFTLFVVELTLDRLRKAAIMAIKGKTVEDGLICGVNIDESGHFENMPGWSFLRKVQLTHVPGVFLIETIGEVAELQLKELTKAIASNPEIMDALKQQPIMGVSPVGKKPVSGYIVDVNQGTVIGLVEDDKINSIELASNHTGDEIVLLGYDDTKLEFVSTYSDGLVDCWSPVDEIAQRSIMLRSRDVNMQIDIGDNGIGLYANGVLIEGTDTFEIEKLRHNPSAPKAAAYAVTKDGLVITIYLQGTEVTHSTLGELLDDRSEPIVNFGEWSIESGIELEQLGGIGFFGARQTAQGFESRRFQAMAQ